MSKFKEGSGNEPLTDWDQLGVQLKEALAAVEKADQEFLKTDLGKKLSASLGGDNEAIETLRALALNAHAKSASTTG